MGCGCAKGSTPQGFQAQPSVMIGTRLGADSLSPSLFPSRPWCPVPVTWPQATTSSTPSLKGAVPMVELCVRLDNGQIVPLASTPQQGGTSPMSSPMSVGSSGASPMVGICIRLSNGQIVRLAPGAQGGTSPMSSPIPGPLSSGASPMAEICIELSNGQLVPLTPATQTSPMSFGPFSSGPSLLGGGSCGSMSLSLNGQAIPLCI
jgi:hypothetical protein